jgi:hypothetical protein
MGGTVNCGPPHGSRDGLSSSSTSTTTPTTSARSSSNASGVVEQPTLAKGRPHLLRGFIRQTGWPGVSGAA